MRVLVTAATRHGATGEIADALATGLERRGIAADSISMADVHALHGYDAVVLGSAVYLGHWLAPAREFAHRHATRLREIPVWLFSSGPLGPPGRELPPGEPNEAGELAAATGARDHVVFAGRLARDELELAERVAVRMVHAPYGDSRDWASIDAFAGEIAEALSADGVRSA
jgi:menaquinone-dependent protoporphyrinogen oxidase